MLQLLTVSNSLKRLLHLLIRSLDLRVVIASLRQLSPVAVDLPVEIRYMLMRRYASIASTNLPLSSIVLGMVLAGFGREAPPLVLLAIWATASCGYGVRYRMRIRTLRRMERADRFPKSADHWYEWIPRLSVVVWSATPLLLQPWVSMSNLICIGYVAVGVIATTAVSNVAALPACFFFLTANGMCLAVFLLAQRSMSYTMLAALAGLMTITLLQRVVGLHRTLVRSLVAERDKATLVRELQVHRDALASENQQLGLSLLSAARAAHRDPLTGLFNRRYIDDLLPPVRRQIDAEGEKVALCVVDIDHFKAINDRYGHPVGDQVLQAVSELLDSRLRHGDCLARMGGEEFMAVLRDCDLREARRVSESFRAKVAAKPIATTGGHIVVTVSVGTVRWRSGESFEDAFDRADQALYRAKEDGRDRIVIDGLATLPSQLSDSIPSSSIH